MTMANLCRAITGHYVERQKLPQSCYFICAFSLSTRVYFFETILSVDKLLFLFALLSTNKFRMVEGFQTVPFWEIRPD